MTLRYQHLFTSVDAANNNSKKEKPFRIMEIGVFHGVHGKQMIERATKNGRQNIEFYGFDLFEEMTSEVNEVEFGKQTLALSYPAVLKYLQTKTRAKVIKLFKGDTKQVLPEIIGALPKMDIIFIDGGHSLGTIQSDFEYALKLAHDKTIILCDDYYANDYSKGCAFLVDHDLKARKSLKVEVLEPVDFCNNNNVSIQIVKVTKTGEVDDLTVEPVVETVSTPSPEVPPEPANFPEPADSVHNSDVQPAGLCAPSCEDSPCEHAKQHCNGSGRCQSGVGPCHLELPTAGPVDSAPLSEERQEPDQKLELGAVESAGTEHTHSGSDEQRRDVPEELVSDDTEGSSKRSRRSRRSRNKRSGSQTEATDSQPDEGLSDQ
jgi:hypothetical protein